MNVVSRGAGVTGTDTVAQTVSEGRRPEGEGMLRGPCCLRVPGNPVGLASWRPVVSRALVLVMAGLSLVPPLSAQPLTPLAAAPAPVTVVADSARADSLQARSPVARADTARVVMHHFNHRQQIVTGTAIMAALAAVMVVMNNYNPRVPQ